MKMDRVGFEPTTSAAATLSIQNAAIEGELRNPTHFLSPSSASSLITIMIVRLLPLSSQCNDPKEEDIRKNDRSESKYDRRTK
jgi:hypothetical protein